MSKILLAEDDEAMRHFLSKALANKGYDVIDCADGKTALTTIAEQGDFDLLVTDIVMPGLDGIELSNKAKAIIPRLKIIYITGFSAMNVGEPKQTGHNTPIKTLSKPFHLKDLIEQVEQALSE